jgi:FkbM family methyltransferase
VNAILTATTRARRAARSAPALGPLLRSPALRRAIAAARAAPSLRPAGRFLAGEARPHGVGRYALRGTPGTTVHLRHGSRDVEIFNEIFTAGRACYAPPPAVAAALAALGPLSVADLGGNIGLFGLYALGRWRVRTLRSYEPDPANAALLRATVAANDATRWEPVQAAVSNRDTTATFEVGLLSESRLAAGERSAAKTIDVPVLDLFAQPTVDLLKIDIEGAEWPILADPRLAAHAASVIVLEWHRRMCPAPDPRAHARELLRGAGYGAIFEAGEQSSTNGVMWGLRR